MRVCEPTVTLCAALEFVSAANRALAARKTAEPDVAAAMSQLVREFHSIACKVGLVSRLRGDQRFVFDVAIAALEDEMVRQGVWQVCARRSRAAPNGNPG